MKRKTWSGIFLLVMAFCQKVSAQPETEINKHLSVITSLVVKGDSEELLADSVLQKYLKIELITKEDFIARQKSAVNWLVADTTKIKKKKGVLRLVTATGSKTFADKLVDNDSRQEFQYLGQLAFLNAYLVECMYWEDFEYKLISKKNGATLASFSAMPYASSDKKKIVLVYADPYENDSGIELFSIANSSIRSTLNVRFKNWMPAIETSLFWGNDGKIYIPIQYADKFWNTDGSFNTDYLYIRISLL